MIAQIVETDHPQDPVSEIGDDPCQAPSNGENNRHGEDIRQQREKLPTEGPQWLE